MIEFRLNNKKISTSKPSGSLLLDFIRQEERLMGTKIGCREGDCGACTVLIGELKDGQMKYQQVPSCLTPIGNLSGKQVVTIEGLNMEKLSPVQHHFVEESGTQCGFCTPGFVVGLTQHCLSEQPANYDKAIASISGNICRCTGYKSIERATKKVNDALSEKDTNKTIEWLVDHDFIPAYFNDVPKELKILASQVKTKRVGLFVGGGTDLYVQRHESLVKQNLDFSVNYPALRFIKIADSQCKIGGGSTVTDLLESKPFTSLFPQLVKHLKLVSSAMIRNVSTLAGNFVNASPIGDMTAFFLALDAKITLTEEAKSRTIYLKDFYKGYKDLDKTAGEIITEVIFNIPFGKFNFEKVSKRTHLDIASVNSAVSFELIDNIFTKVHLSAGGIGPIPTYLHNTCKYLNGKALSAKTIMSANEVMQAEISPISDVRGSVEYKRLLLRQLFFGHFIELFPEMITLDKLVSTY